SSNVLINRLILVEQQQKHSRNVQTSIASTFNQLKTNQLNAARLLKDPKSTGLFGKSELQRPEGFHVLKEKALQESNQLVQEAISQQRKRKMVQIFDQLSNSLCKVADLCEFVKIGHPNPAF